jgi:hypothetical protein
MPKLGRKVVDRHLPFVTVVPDSTFLLTTKQRRKNMKKSTLTNSQLLDLIEKEKLNAQKICEKAGISIWTLRKRHHVLMMNEKRFINVEGLFDPDNVAELKKGGISISAKKLDALKNPHSIGTKFQIDINAKSKKIVLTATG